MQGPFATLNCVGLVGCNVSSGSPDIVHDLFFFFPGIKESCLRTLSVADWLAGIKHTSLDLRNRAEASLVQEHLLFLFLRVKMLIH